MGRLSRFLRLPSAERRLFVKAACATAAIRMGLVVLPFRTVASLVARWAHRHGTATPTVADRDRLVRAVSRAQAHVPGRATCLQEALVGHLMLARIGFPAQPRIGVRKGPCGDLQAHAWVEIDGEVVIGGPLTKVRSFTPLENLRNFDRAIVSPAGRD